MNPTLTTTAENGGNFDPQQAVVLLDQTTRQARRRFEPFPPWLWVTRGVAVLAVCGAAWLSVRGQHPYKSPTAAVLPVVFAFVVLNLIGTVVVAKRATAGVSGRSRLRPAEIAVMAVAWLGVFVAMGALAGAGVSDSIVYGVYPTTAPLMAAGLAWAGIMAARANWRKCGSALVVAAVGGGGVFAGPVWSWLVAGVGLFAVCLGNAGAIARRQRA
jgi:hypothetical protein